MLCCILPEVTNDTTAQNRLHTPILQSLQSWSVFWFAVSVCLSVATEEVSYDSQNIWHYKALVLQFK